jgi:hypothetical protein
VANGAPGQAGSWQFSPPQCPIRGSYGLLWDSGERPHFVGTQKYPHQKWRRIAQNRHASRQAADTKRFVDEMCRRSSGYEMCRRSSG